MGEHPGLRGQVEALHDALAPQQHLRRRDLAAPVAAMQDSMGFRVYRVYDLGFTELPCRTATPVSAGRRCFAL